MAGVIAMGVYAKLIRNRDAVTVRNVVVDQSWEPFAAPTFSLIDQEGKPFGSEQLKGKPYVAAFIFTHFWSKGKAEDLAKGIKTALDAQKKAAAMKH